MELFAQAIQDFSVLPHIESWQEAQALFQQAAARRPNHWLLPVRACEAVGGAKEKARPAVLAVGCTHLSLLLVDDMLDADPRGSYHHLGMPTCANLACTFQAAALHAIGQCSQDLAARLAALDSFNAMFLATTFGQFLDANTKMPHDEVSYWRVTQAKSSPFFGAAMQVGALAGGGTLQTARSLNQLGCLYGEMIQIHDDMHDSMETPANPDWVQGRYPLPILFAALVKHPEQQRFRALSQMTSDPTALQEAQEILIHCGAISYCADQLLRKHSTAKRILGDITLRDHRPILSLLDEVVSPVHKLLEAVGK